MNLAKARDYFSAYYEGSLDRGLRQTFETRLSEDAQLQAEYKAFEKTMKGLEAFGALEVEPPVDLHEKISARLDNAIWEQKRVSSRLTGFAWWKAAVMGAAVTAGVAVVFLRTSHPSNGQTADMIMSGAGLSRDFSFKAEAHGVSLSYESVDHATVIIKDSTGRVTTVPLDHQGITDKLLESKSPDAGLWSVETADQSTPTSYIALPGKTLDPTTAGKGTIKDLALALAAHYGKPVVVQAKDEADRSTSWDLSSTDELAAAKTALQGLGIAVSEKAPGVISIEKS